MRIFYSDASVVVCAKPAGVQSENATLEQKNPRTGMPELLAQEDGGAAYYPVHRLDTAAAGLMVYAKTREAAAALSRAVTNGQFEKKYLALVHGKTEETGECFDLLFKDASRNKSYVVSTGRRGVKEAYLTYERLKYGETPYGDASLVFVTLKTGRTHQIRVQFSSRGWPLLGDGKYGAKDRCPFLALFSAYLSFPHPVTGNRMTFEADPDFLDLLE